LAGRQVPTAFLPLGIDTSHFRPVAPEVTAAWRRRLAIPDDATVFMSVRAMAPVYGHHHILEAFAKVCPGAARRSVLLFKTYNCSNYPEGPAYASSLRQRAQELGLADSLRWVTEVPYADLPALYSVADAIVNYPSMDAFPVTFIEAAACMRPVITVDLPAYQGTFVEHAFRLVRPNDVDGLAAAFQTQTEGVSMAHFDKTRALVEREYDESVSANRLLGHYADLMRKNGTPSRHDSSCIIPGPNPSTRSGCPRTT
jgi:glycosyltransferase involved in cell wall biosynthesis